MIGLHFYSWVPHSLLWSLLPTPPPPPVTTQWIQREHPIKPFSLSPPPTRVASTPPSVDKVTCIALVLSRRSSVGFTILLRSLKLNLQIQDIYYFSSPLASLGRMAFPNSPSIFPSPHVSSAHQLYFMCKSNSP